MTSTNNNIPMEIMEIISNLGFTIVKKTKGSILLVGSYSNDDTASITKAAEQYGLSIVLSDNWEDAREMLKENFLKWHAIVLDGKAKLSKGEEETSMFLRDAIDDLNIIFSRKLNEIPWFIMPRMYDEQTKTIIKYTVSRDREKKDWGKCVFTTDEIQPLVSHIADILPQTKNFRLRRMYNNVFQTIEDCFPDEVQDLIFDVLQPLHNPESFFSFVPEESYDNVRRTLEAFFIVCCNYGLIPPEICYKSDATVNLRICSDFIKVKENQDVFPITIGELVEFILDHTNPGCHFGTQDKIEGFYYSVMSLALQMCDVIVWIGKYIKEHECVDVTDMIPQYENKIIQIEKDDNGVFFYRKCCFKRIDWVSRRFDHGDKVVMKNVKVNTGPNKQIYPLFAEVQWP